MKKIKYYYNTNTLRYEKLETPLRVKLLRIFGFIAAAFVTAALISFFAFQFIGSPKEKILQMQNERLQDRYEELDEKTRELQKQITELEKIEKFLSYVSAIDLTHYYMGWFLLIPCLYLSIS